MNILDIILDLGFDLFDWFISLFKKKQITLGKYPKTISISIEAMFQHIDVKYRDR